jgi:hypothetical protein
MPGDSVDAVVCDPPYGLEFMGKEFDKLGKAKAMQAWHEVWARPRPLPFGKRPSPTDPPRYLGGDGRFAHGAQVGRDGAASGGAREPSVRGQPSGPTFRPEDFGV